MPTIHDVFKERGKKKAPEEAFQIWKDDPTPAGLRTAVSKLQPVIDSAVRNYAGVKAPQTVYHRARLMAADALKGYDPDRGTALKTHIFNQLRPLTQMGVEISDPLPPPARFRQQAAEIQRASEMLEDQLGREPTEEEIADLTQLPLRRVIKVRDRSRARLPTSKWEETDDEDEESPDVVASEHDPYDDWVDAVYHDLGDLDRRIMAHRTGYRGAEILTNSDIARRLNVSPAAISQRARRIQERLDEYHATF